MNPESAPQQQTAVPFRTALSAWFLISLQTFGGPAGQIAVMQRTLVDEKRWIGQRRFLHALNYCTLLPGPEAQQLATYVGWLLHGTRGGWSPADSSCCPAWSRSSCSPLSTWRSAPPPW
ncbi:chromate transporter [Blastococcus sp. PRF04-17]|nr:chromate transporter [Blastococcus sp. PRF04-17]UOY01205.1 chromate transporter [Blastococcus sp. PRF04-17]